MIRTGFLVGMFIALLTSNLIGQSSPEVVNPIAMIKSIDSDEKDRFADPSNTGLPAGDLNDDGAPDFIQHWETWRDLRGFTNSYNMVTTFLSYDASGEVTHASFVDGTYFPVGDLDGDGITEVASVNSNSGYIEMHSISTDVDEAFIVNSSDSELVSEQRYYSLSYSLPGFFDGDAFGDVLLCENTFNAFDECIIIFGKGDEATPTRFTEFNLSDLGADFSSAPRMFLAESISGTGLGIYVMGELSGTFQSMMYELGFDENDDVELAFSHEWERTSGEQLADKRFFIDDFDGDDELEILASDDRSFQLGGFQRVYFGTPWCDIRDIDFSGDTPVLQTPEIISTNCLVDRVIQPDLSQDPGKAVLSQNEDDEPIALIWQQGNYSSCTSSDLYQSCSNMTTVTNDQTMYPCSYNSCSSRPYYYSYTQYPYYYNGYANPQTSTRGLWYSTITNRSQYSAQNRSSVSELSRISEIYRIAAKLETNQTVTQEELQLYYSSGFAYVEYGYSCSDSSPSCSQYNNTYINYYDSGEEEEDNPNDAVSNESRLTSDGTYHHYTVATPIDNATVEDNFIIRAFDSETLTIDKPKKATIPTDTIQAFAEFNLEVLGDVDANSAPYVMQNIGNVDGIPGEELLVGTNFARNNNSPINKAWIYLGTNTTYDAPDVTVEFINDSTITPFSFLQVGNVADHVGDVNGDGIGDFAIGLVNYNRKSNSSGGVFVYPGRDFSTPGNDTLTTPMAILEPNPEETQTTYAFGAQVSGGDFDGDGFSDIAVLTDQGSGTPKLPTITVYKGGEDMDAEPDYFLYVTPNDVGSFGSDTLTTFFGAVIHFMPKNDGENHQDLYFTPGGFSGHADAVIFRGGMDAALKAKGINQPASTPAYTLAEAGPTSTGTGVFLRSKPATGDFNGDGFYDVAVVKQFDGRDALISSRALVFSPSSGIVVTNVEETENPLEYRLSQNYPNPFNPTTTIEFRLAQPTNVTLSVYDILGRRVAVLINNAPYSAGTQQVQFDASRLASGFYLYRLEAGSFVQTRKMMLIK